MQFWLGQLCPASSARPASPPWQASRRWARSSRRCSPPTGPPPTPSTPMRPTHVTGVGIQGGTQPLDQTVGALDGADDRPGHAPGDQRHRRRAAAEPGHQHPGTGAAQRARHHRGDRRGRPARRRPVQDPRLRLKDDVYVDGLRDFGAYTRDSFNFEEVQVLKGPSGAMFGAAPPSGVINTVSKQARLDDFVSVDAYAATGEYYRGLADINHQLSDTSAVRLTLMAASTGVVDRDTIYSERWGDRAERRLRHRHGHQAHHQRPAPAHQGPARTTASSSSSPPATSTRARPASSGLASNARPSRATPPTSTATTPTC